MKFIDRRSQDNQIGMKTVSIFGDDGASFSGRYNMLHRHGMRLVERRKQAQMLKMVRMCRTGRIAGNMNDNQLAADDSLRPMQSLQRRIGEISRHQDVVPVASRCKS